MTAVRMEGKATGAHDNDTGREKVLIFDSISEIPAFCKENGTIIDGNTGWTYMSAAQTLECCMSGNLETLEYSDKYLSKFEGLIQIDTHRNAWKDSVTGSFPIVPAYISGHPLNMKRRMREASQSAPMAIVVDTTISGGFSKQQIQARGAAILALVRLLGAVRPLELYVACGLGAANNGATWIFSRIDTAPLDLARAAFALCHPSFPRGIGYPLTHTVNKSGNGGWPYNNHATMQKRFHAVCRRWLPHLEEVLALPGAISTDETHSNPEKWLKDKLAIFAPMVATD